MNRTLLADLLAERIALLTITPDGTCTSAPPPPGALLSGSFNPLHQGHLGMAAAAAQLGYTPLAFELPVINADKGSLALAEVERRAAQFAGTHTLVLSRAPRFIDKAHLFPGSTFVLGYDTAVRLLDPRYYHGTAGLHASLDELRAAGCRFLVAGRRVTDHFATIADLDLPSGYEDMFCAIPPEIFRMDISSTELRQRAIAESQPDHERSSKR